MARIFSADDDTYAQMSYSRYQPGVQDFIQQQMNLAAGMLNTAGQALFRNAQQVFQMSLENPAIRMASAAMRQVQSLWGTNNVQYLDELWKVQNAPAVMIPFVMAHPELSKLYGAQRCDGYQGKWIPMQTGAVGADNLHWRAVNSGMFGCGEDVDADVAVTYSSTFDEYLPTTLSFEDQVDVMHTWRHVDRAIELGRDPTDAWDGDL